MPRNLGFLGTFPVLAALPTSVGSGRTVTLSTDGHPYFDHTSGWRLLDAQSTGDMLKATYDSNNNGVVDNAETLGGFLPGQFAKTISANTFTAAQTFSGPLVGGLTAGAGDATRTLSNLVIPRDSDFYNINQDYQDEMALGHLNPAWTISLTSNGVVGSASNAFIDDTSNYSNTGTVFPVVVTVDMSAASVPNRGNGYFRLGVTFRGSLVATSILIETWTGTAYATVINVTGLTGADFTSGLFWVSGQFLGNTSNFNMEKLRVTFGGTNPTSSAFILQRLILYHPTAPLNPWHLHRLGGTLYGNANWQAGAPQVAGLSVWHPGNLTPGVTTPVRTVTANYTVLLSDGTIFVDCTAGPVTITLPTAASAIVNGQGQRVRVKKIDTTANAVTITATGGQIDGAASAVISTPYNVFEFSPIPGTANWGGF